MRRRTFLHVLGGIAAALTPAGLRARQLPTEELPAFVPPPDPSARCPAESSYFGRLGEFSPFTERAEVRDAAGDVIGELGRREARALHAGWSARPHATFHVGDIRQLQDGTIVATSEDGRTVQTSPDGVNWTARDPLPAVDDPFWSDNPPPMSRGRQPLPDFRAGDVRFEDVQLGLNTKTLHARGRVVAPVRPAHIRFEFSHDDDES